MKATRNLRHFATPASDSVSRPRTTEHSFIAERTRNLPCQESNPLLGLPQVWRTDGVIELRTEV